MDAAKQIDRFIISEDLHVELPVLIREVLYARRWTAERLASSLGIGHSTLNRWQQGQPGQVEVAPYRRLTDLHNDAQPMLLMKGIDAANLVCCCNFSTVYTGDFRADARPPLNWLLSHPQGMAGRNVHPVALDIRVRSTVLPTDCRGIVFTNGRSEKPEAKLMFVILTNYNRPKRDQWQFVHDKIFAEIRPTVEQMFSESFSRRINLRPPIKTQVSGGLSHCTHQEPDIFVTKSAAHRDNVLATPREVYEAVYDLCYGAGYPPKLLAPTIGVSRPTLTRWMRGDVEPRPGPALAALGHLRAMALKIIRMKFINPMELVLFTDWECPPPHEHISAANDALNSMLTKIGLELHTGPIGIALDLVGRSAPVGDHVSAHCFSNLSSPPDLFVILTNPHHASAQQFNTFFDELYAHVVPQYRNL